MFKAVKFSVAVLLFSCPLLPVFAQDGSSNPDTVFIYEEMVGGPYFDEWYVTGDLNNLNHISIYREGKSGALEATIQINCQLSTLVIQGTGLLYESIVLTNEKTREYFSKDVIQAITNKMCTKQLD